MPSKPIVIIFAFSALLILSAAWMVWPVGMEWARLAVLALGAALLVAANIGLFLHRRRAKYDLGALRELHEQGGPPPSDEDLPEVDEDAGVFCPNCGTVYAGWMPVCPNCKR